MMERCGAAARAARAGASRYAYRAQLLNNYTRKRFFRVRYTRPG